MYLFKPLSLVTAMAWEEIMDYGEERPHKGLGDVPPLPSGQKMENSSFALSREQGSGLFQKMRNTAKGVEGGVAAR
ncbi:MAG: hypothetical protein AAGI44_00265 [Pseudomonadota bacterium]